MQCVRSAETTQNAPMQSNISKRISKASHAHLKRISFSRFHLKVASSFRKQSARNCSATIPCCSVHMWQRGTARCIRVQSHTAWMNVHQDGVIVMLKSVLAHHHCGCALISSHAVACCRTLSHAIAHCRMLSHAIACCRMPSHAVACCRTLSHAWRRRNWE